MQQVLAADDHGDVDVVECSPEGRYVRYSTLVGSGSYKTVYRGQDMEIGRDIAWNVIDITHYTNKEKKRILEEVKLLRQLRHRCLLQFYGSWFDTKTLKVVFVTELFHAGTLKQFCNVYPISIAQVRTEQSGTWLVVAGTVTFFNPNTHATTAPRLAGEKVCSRHLGVPRVPAHPQSTGHPPRLKVRQHLH